MVFRRQTVFVIGAGASCELGFPSGPALLQQIASTLDVRFDHHHQKAGSHQVMGAYRRHHKENRPESDLNDYLLAGWRLRDAAKVARSIDNAMDQNGDDPLVAIAGKFAIADNILEAERKSALFVDPYSLQAVSIEKVKETWLHYFAQMLTTDLRRTDVNSIFDRVKIITFNYDRSVEHYLPAALSVAYGLSEEEAKAIVARLEIHHAYGQVGSLPWLSSGSGTIAYGSDDRHDLGAIAADLQTFSESREPDEQLSQMHGALETADQIVFLGFGYHRPNMDLLRPKAGVYGRIIGTVYQEPSPARAVAKDLLGRLFVASLPDSVKDITLSLSPCGQFMSDNFPVLTS